METIAFVGKSGTGKSHRSIMVAQKYGADGIIDDGLLISCNKVVAGTSAKREATRIASVKHALFLKQELADEIKDALKKHNINRLMILGTSEDMAEKIAARLEVSPITKFIHIEEIATPEEMEMAQEMRLGQGKHVIPVPTFEIKKEFSGYFLHPLRFLQKNMDGVKDRIDMDKSIVRPTFSYLGDYTISDNVIHDIVLHETEKLINVDKVNYINLRKTEHGLHIDMTVTLYYGCLIDHACRGIQMQVKKYIEEYTSVNVRRVHVYAKGLTVRKN